MIGIELLSLKRGMLMKLPRKVATKISTIMIGLKPTSANATPIMPTKTRPIRLSMLEVGFRRTGNYEGNR
jgi:hypothetical protein